MTASFTIGADWLTGLEILFQYIVQALCKLAHCSSTSSSDVLCWLRNYVLPSINVSWARGKCATICIYVQFICMHSLHVQFVCVIYQTSWWFFPSISIPHILTSLEDHQVAIQQPCFKCLIYSFSLLHQTPIDE